MTEPRQPDRGALSAEQAAFLISSGAFTEQGLAEVQACVARGELAAHERRTAQNAIAQSLAAEDVAALLHIDVSEVEQRRTGRELFAFVFEGACRYPTWQFTGDPGQPVLPHMAAVVDAFPASMHPATVLGFMSTPQRSALRDGQRVTLPVWLLAGGDPQVLRDILDAYLCG